MFFRLSNYFAIAFKSALGFIEKKKTAFFIFQALRHNLRSSIISIFRIASDISDIHCLELFLQNILFHILHQSKVKILKCLRHSLHVRCIRTVDSNCFIVCVKTRYNDIEVLKDYLRCVSSI